MKIRSTYLSVGEEVYELKGKYIANVVLSDETKRSFQPFLGLDLVLQRWYSGSQLSLAGAATSIIFVETNVLSRQARVCSDKSMLPQQNVCGDKHTFVATKDVFCRGKHVFVSKKVSNYVCRNKCLSRQKFCILFSGQTTCFVETNTCLSRQK